jgi:hypothetical protein
MAFTYNPRIVNSGGDMAPNMIVGAEAGSQTYKAGELVYGNDPAITVCGADPALVLGIAQKDATGTTSADAPVEVIRPTDLVMILVSSAGTATTSDNAVIGEDYGLVLSSNVWSLDTADETNTRAVVVDQVQEVSGSYTNYAIVRFKSANLQFGNG